MADEVTVRELRAGLADFLRRANAGETIVITRLGRVDAQLGPVRKESDDGGPWAFHD